MENVKALIYDVFGTVVDWRRGIAGEAKAFLGDEKGHDLDWEVFADTWRGQYQPSMERIRKGERPFTKLDILHRENLVTILPEFGVSGLSEAEIDHLNTAWHRLPPWPDSAPGLIRLKIKFIIGTQSNGNIALMVNMAKHGGLPWDVILGAEVVQAYKPQPEAYLRACAALGLAPSEVMMVAAHTNDLLAAQAQGLRTAFVARPLEFGTKNPKADIEPHPSMDVSAWSFTELADKLGC
ncbi:MAG: haloacid dehalogenase type II [Alphaproteobacteria bacterium]|jgi:2-haloacid dehalogenase